MLLSLLLITTVRMVFSARLWAKHGLERGADNKANQNPAGGTMLLLLLITHPIDPPRIMFPFSPLNFRHAPGRQGGTSCDQ